jgi:hypothetical protein
MGDCTGSAYIPGGILTASCITNSTIKGSQSSFLDKHGEIIGWSLITFWLIIALILLIVIYKKKNITKKEKMYYSIGPILLFLLVIIDMIYFFASKSKNRNMVFANIAMIPLYLLLVICVFIIIIAGGSN